MGPVTLAGLDNEHNIMKSSPHALGDEGWVGKAHGPREVPFRPVVGLMLLRKGTLKLNTAFDEGGLSLPPQLQISSPS